MIHFFCVTTQREGEKTFYAGAVFVLVEDLMFIKSANCRRGAIERQ